MGMDPGSGVGVTKAPIVDFSVRKIFDLAKEPFTFIGNRPSNSHPRLRTFPDEEPAGFTDTRVKSPG